MDQGSHIFLVILQPRSECTDTKMKSNTLHSRHLYIFTYYFCIVLNGRCSHYCVSSCDALTQNPELMFLTSIWYNLRRLISNIAFNVRHEIRRKGFKNYFSFSRTVRYRFFLFVRCIFLGLNLNFDKF